MPRSVEIEYDLFISHSKVAEDSNWVHNYLIPALGISKDRIITRDSFRLGEDIIDEFSRAITTSKYTFVILTQAYINDNLATCAEKIALFTEVDEDRVRLIPILKEPCDIPRTIDIKVKVDFTDESIDPRINVASLLNLLEMPLPEEQHLECPYPGMKSFSFDDDFLFCGRDEKINDMISHIRHNSFLILLGPSGSGKTSLIFGGFLPKLLKSRTSKRNRWLAISMRPLSSPMRELQFALGIELEELGKEIRDLLKQQEKDELLLIIDQFEELFTLSNRKTGNEFLDVLLKLIDLDCCTVIVSMRSAFYENLQTSKLWDKVKGNRCHIKPLVGDDLRKAIRHPANKRFVYIDPGLVEQLVAEAADEPGYLPMIQETMHMLWERMEGTSITRDDYRKLGNGKKSGLAEAFSRVADNSIKGLSDKDLAVVRAILLRLIHLEEGVTGVRRQQTKIKLRSVCRSKKRFDNILSLLEEKRILTLSEKEQKVDISHEVLIREWKILREWIKELKDSELRRRVLMTKYTEWQRFKKERKEGGLLDAAELPEAKLYLNSPDAIELGSVKEIKSLVDASESWRKRQEEQRNILRNQSLVRALTGHAMQRYEKFHEHEKAALLARQAYLFYDRWRGNSLSIVDATLRDILSKPDYSITIDVSSRCTPKDYRTRTPRFSYSRDGEILFINCTQHFHTIHFNDSRYQTTNPSRYMPVRSEIAFDNRDQLVAYVSDLSEICVYDRGNLKKSPLILSYKETPIESLDISKDGRLLVASLQGGKIVLWDLMDLENEPQVLNLYNQYSKCSSVAFNDSGNSVAVAFPKSGIVLYDLSKDKKSFGKVVADSVLADSTNAKLLFYGPKGKYLGVIFSNERVKIWDFSKPQISPIEIIHDRPTCLAFSPDNDIIAIGNSIGLIHLYSLKNSENPFQILQGHTWEVSHVSFSPQGSTMASSSRDGTIRIWYLFSPPSRPIIREKNPKLDRSTCIKSSNDLVALSGFGSIEFFSTHRPDQIEFQLLEEDRKDWIVDMDFDAQNKYFACVGATGAKLWFLDRNHCELVQNIPTDYQATSLLFLNNGRNLIFTEYGGMLYSYDTELKTLEKYEQNVSYPHGMVFDSNSSDLIVGADDGHLWRLDVSDGDWKFRKDRKYGEKITNIAISENSKYLALGHGTNIIHVLDLKKNTSTQINHDFNVQCFAFHPTMNFLVTGGAFNRIQMWDLDNLANYPIQIQDVNIIPLFGKVTCTRANIVSLAFAEHGKWLISGAWDGSVHMRRANTEDLANIVCERAWSNLSNEDWKYFIGEDIHYEKTISHLPDGFGI
ncbi:MAG: TIR domain-containing protein [Candidatus Thorarchaeota archaeon]